MGESSISIINHIPHFLVYCHDKAYSVSTQENYRHYLRQFIYWLKKINKQAIRPHELTAEDIEDYKSYLNHFRNPEGRPLKKSTQNYYLIALRALLGYFVQKDVVSLLPAKISLPRGFNSTKTVKFLNITQVERLLAAPDTKTVPGLRDKTILETMVSTGLKIRRITNLDRNQLDEIPSEAAIWIKQYLRSRRDENKALFINYKARKGSLGGRLTARSIERIVNYYGRKIGLPFLVTPETLRWARAHALSNEIIEIRKPQAHQVSEVEKYWPTKRFSTIAPKTYSTWNAVENAINKEILWLKNNIPVLPEAYKGNPPFLKYDEIISRKIAILIVSGKIEAVEFTAKNKGNLWDNRLEKYDLKRISRHGQEWHKKIMDVIYDYFETGGGEIIIEPALNYGRGDLGIYFKPDKNIYVEVDTVSLFKLWYNLSTMKKATFLIIQSENRTIEFTT